MGGCVAAFVLYGADYLSAQQNHIALDSMIELFRQCVLYGKIMDWKMLVYATVISVVTLIVGILFFNKKSDDIIFHL